jgi:hypothetical protein
VIFVAFWSTPLIIVTAYLSQVLRRSIESHQASVSSNSTTNEDS